MIFLGLGSGYKKGEDCVITSIHGQLDTHHRRVKENATQY